MNVLSSTELVFKLTQPEEFRKSPAQLRFVYLKDIEENKEIEEKLWHQDGFFTEGQFTTFLESENELNKGTYYIFIEFDDVKIDYCLTILSSNKVNVKTLGNFVYDSTITHT